MVRWRKLGRVYCADGKHAWAKSHAYCPTAFVRRDDERIRVLCAFLDPDHIGRCGWVDVAVEDPTRVLEVSASPVLEEGAPGTFDEHGVTPLSIVRLPGDALRLYYAGWQRGVGVRYALFLGAAESDDDGASFRRVSEAPLLDRSDGELYTRSSALVIATDEGWRMWYAGGSEWVGAGADAKPRYALRHLRSADGVAWPRSGEICLEPAPGELGFSRPCVRVTANTIHMWYSLRTVLRGYDLGYATSVDGMAWQRMDQAAGLERGPHGSWDAEMIGLSSLLETGSDALMFYNGNGYGATGFGVAVAEEV
ncbi:MAG: glucosyl hydrolase [Solirubrobacteraceae bacterium]